MTRNPIPMFEGPTYALAAHSSMHCGQYDCQSDTCKCRAIAHCRRIAPEYLNNCLSFPFPVNSSIISALNKCTANGRVLGVHTYAFQAFVITNRSGKKIAKAHVLYCMCR
jgi:hypothetical protein